MNGKTMEELMAENEKLRAQLEEKNRIPGVPDGLEADVRRRVAGGLPLHHAITAARSQQENDERIAREEAAAARANKAKAREADELAAAQKRIAELEAKLAKGAQ